MGPQNWNPAERIGTDGHQEWKNHLRSAIHPALFAIVYRIAAAISWALRLSPTLRANFLIAAPKAAQACCAAFGDYYTWKLGEKIYGSRSNEAWAAVSQIRELTCRTNSAQLALTTCSPWQWFCSTRTLSNCLETTLTVIALNFWPWSLSVNRRGKYSDAVSESQEQADEDYVHVGEGSPRVFAEEPARFQSSEDKADGSNPQEQDTKYYNLRRSLRSCLLLASLACILRPTNVLIWICFACFATLRTTTYGQFMDLRWVESPVWVHITSLELFPATQQERKAFILEGIFCGSGSPLSSRHDANANVGFSDLQFYFFQRSLTSYTTSNSPSLPFNSSTSTSLNHSQCFTERIAEIIT